ncbi:phosphatase PAP2 family protein [Streptomyces odontomachi]|uniref:phosphatase PAP2 family protein n=1 Tax=Streptomyces odontomachi TaxID=2944940 RepID=UPI00210E128D|nr:phosphatase PAP2 family protein [Streptomyces sp. ODS25]
MGDRTVTAVDGMHNDSPSPMPDGRAVAPAPGLRGAHDACGARPERTVRSVLLRLRRPRRPHLWFEILLIVASYEIYSLIRSIVPQQRAMAIRNADWLWELERRLGIAVEGVVNRAVNSETWLIVGMNYYYATLHFAVTICVLIWLYRHHPGRYAATRLVLLVTTASALIGYYAYPLAPPRLISGTFVDTVVAHHTWGSMSESLKDVSNQYAAMPSMHVGWSLWCGLTIFCLAKSPWARTFAVLYPTATTVVIVATANHFWLDAVGGAICLVFGYGVARWWYGALPYALPRLIPAPRAPHALAPLARRAPRGASALSVGRRPVARRVRVWALSRTASPTVTTENTAPRHPPEP